MQNAPKSLTWSEMTLVSAVFLHIYQKLRKFCQKVQVRIILIGLICRGFYDRF